MNATAHPPDTTLGRFGIETYVDSADPFVAAIPMAGLINPVTGVASVAPLAVLVDYVAGLVNHYRRADDEWTVSSELSIDLGADTPARIASAPDVPVLASARPFGTKGSTSIGRCEISHADVVIGFGMVRSVHIRLPGGFPGLQQLPENASPSTELAAIMALRVGEVDSAGAVLYQSPNPVLNNTIGSVHGGVAAAGLELAASAALNFGRRDEPLQTASLKVNFMRQFVSGGQSRYSGTSLRTGRRSGLAEARAIGADGEIALSAQITAYR